MNWTQLAQIKSNAGYLEERGNRDPELRSRSDHQLDLFQGIPGSTPRLRLYLANWSASFQLGFSAC